METITGQHSRVLKWILVIGIVVVLNLFFNYTIHLFYPQPQWEKFCPQRQVTKLVTENDCVAAGGAWTETLPPPLIDERPATPKPIAETATGYCNADYTCQQEYEAARAVYNRNVFAVLVVLGLAAILIGFFATSATAVSLGLSLGGVLSLIIGSMRYWSAMQDYLRVILLAVALGVLIWLGIKKLKD